MSIWMTYPQSILGRLIASFWIPSGAGDANLDGRFDSSDLVRVFQAGEYEDSNRRNSSWADGDWNGDREFTTGDIVLAFMYGNYQRAAKPEDLAIELL